jgi:RNA polymerase sigma-70 factor (ECF subfamily)
VTPGLSRVDFERLFERLERPLYNVVYRWVWTPDDAADVVQEAFVRLWDMRARVDPRTAKALVYRIALNLASTHRRRRQRAWLHLVPPAPPTPTPDEALQTHEDAQRVRAVLERLPEAQRQVLVLCELGDLTYEEIAAVLEIKIGTVGSRRHAALARLRGWLDDQENARAHV